MRLFAQLSWYFRREWRRYLGAVALLIIIAILQLIPPKVVGIIVDGVTTQRFTTERLLMWVGTIALIAVVVYLLRYVWRVLLFGASYQLAVELREDYYRQLSRQHPEFYLRHRTGDLMARATNDVDRVVFAAGEGVLTLVDSLVMGCAVLIVMSTQISWQLTLIALLPMPVMAIMIKRYGDRLHNRFKLAQAAFSSLNDRTQESLTSIRMIKAFGLEDRQSALFAADAEDTGKKNLRVARIDARFDPTIYIAIGMANLLAIAGGSWMVVHGSLTLGQLTSFMMYLGLMIWPMLALAWMFNIVERGSAAYSRIRAMLAEAPVVDDGTEPVPEGRGELAVAIEIPPNFGRDIARGTPVQIGVWVDGAMPNRAETVRGYVQAMHLAWLQEMAARQSSPQRATSLISIETRYRYNPDVRSLPAIVPAVIPLLLMMIPAMLSALSVVREKELGSIINLYVTPTTRSEFLLGKQVPYIVLGMFNFFLLCALSVFVFGVSHKGSFLTLSLAALLYVTIATGLGLLISTFMKSQIAAIFGTAIITLIPATQFSGMIDPVASLEGPGRWIGQIYPTSHFLTIARGTFSKALNISDLWGSFIPLLIAVPLVLGLSVLLLKKQEG